MLPACVVVLRAARAARARTPRLRAGARPAGGPRRLGGRRGAGGGWRRSGDRQRRQAGGRVESGARRGRQRAGGPRGRSALGGAHAARQARGPRIRRAPRGALKPQDRPPEATRPAPCWPCARETGQLTFDTCDGGHGGCAGSSYNLPASPSEEASSACLFLEVGAERTVTSLAALLQRPGSGSAPAAGSR